MSTRLSPPQRTAVRRRPVPTATHAGSLLLLAALTACQLPNVAPFADATLQLRTAVTEGGSVTATAMAGSRHASDAQVFQETWEQRLQLMDVLLAYSDSLASIAAASQQSAQTTAALGDSIQELAGWVPSAHGAAVEAGVNLASVLINAGIQVKGYRDLAEAVEAAHTALAQVADFLQQDLDDARTLYLGAIQDAESDLDARYGEREDRRRRLVALRDEALERFLAEATDDRADQLKQLEELLAATEADHVEYEQARATLAKQRAAALQMFHQAKQGVRAWTQAHQDLKNAIRQKRQPNVRLILSTAQEIRDAVQRLREATNA